MQLVLHSLECQPSDEREEGGKRVGSYSVAVWHCKVDAKEGFAHCRIEQIDLHTGCFELHAGSAGRFSSGSSALLRRPQKVGAETIS